MKVQEIIEMLKDLSSDKYKKNVVKLGIPEEDSIGVSTGEVRNIAKKLQKSNELAYELWKTGYHEAKLLAVLLFENKQITLEDIKELMQDVYSWDLCDHICKNLIIKVSDYEKLIYQWCDVDEIYYKRAAFTLIASTVTKNKKITMETIEKFLDIIKHNSNDSRQPIKKAVSWALREVGKKDFVCQEKAILLAHELLDSDNKTQIWIAKDALKELEKLVQVEGRSRLISRDSQMGNQVDK